MSADLANRTDFDNANRGLVARLEPADGYVVYDADARPRHYAHPRRPRSMLGGGTNGVDFEGDTKAFATITAFADNPDPAFPIVTP